MYTLYIIMDKKVFQALAGEVLTGYYQPVDIILTEEAAILFRVSLKSAAARHHLTNSTLILILFKHFFCLCSNFSVQLCIILILILFILTNMWSYQVWQHTFTAW